MRNRIVWSVFVIFFIATAGFRAHGQDKADTVQVGIVEHLGDTVPGNISFRDEYGKPVSLNELIKRPTILSPVYFDCPGVCPQLLASVANVVKTMDMQLGKDYQVVTFSFDELDTPEKALDKKTSFLDPKSKPNATYWCYLTGDSSNIHKLTNAVGYKFIRAGNGFIHPSGIIILSPSRKITRYLYGTTFLPFDVKMALIEAQKVSPRPTINRVLDFCFSYDPDGRRYSLAVTKISATLIIFFAVILFVSLLIRSSRKKKNTAASSDSSTKTK